MVSPPRAGDDSFEEYVLERDTILDSLRRRAVMLSNALNQLEGVRHNLSRSIHDRIVPVDCK